MIIYDPVSNFFSNMIAKRHRYRCIVDGCDEFRGERLPVGTEEEILAWIKARYKVLGQLFAVDVDCPHYQVWFELGPFPGFDAKIWNPTPTTKRYLVEVEGVEWMFVLRSVPDGLLGWHPGHALS